MPEWIFMEILKAVTPLVIGVGVIYIAGQQHKTNKDRLKMELFDRRYKIYEAMLELTITVPIRKDDVLKYGIKTAQAMFVFNLDIQNALAKVGRIGGSIADIMVDYPANSYRYPVDPKMLAPNLIDLYNNLYKAGRKATVIFAEYITLKV